MDEHDDDIHVVSVLVEEVLDEGGHRLVVYVATNHYVSKQMNTHSTAEPKKHL